jgi:hypothetical protein
VTNIPVLSSMATASKRNYEKLTTKNIAWSRNGQEIHKRFGLIEKIRFINTHSFRHMLVFEFLFNHRPNNFQNKRNNKNKKKGLGQCEISFSCQDRTFLSFFFNLSIS